MRLFALAPVALLLFATPASSQGVPDPAHCRLPKGIMVVGQNGSVADCFGNSTIVVQDANDAPVAGATVIVLMNDCSDIQFSCDQYVHGTTGQSYLGAKHISGDTNALGVFILKAQGAAGAVRLPGNTTSPGTAAGTACATIYANFGRSSYLLGHVPVAAVDVDGLGSPTAAVNDDDVALVAHECVVTALGAQACARDDYNFDGAITGVDAAMEAREDVAVTTCDPPCGCSRQTAPFCP